MRKSIWMLAVVLFFGLVVFGTCGCAGWETPIDRWGKKAELPENIYSHETLRAREDLAEGALVCLTPLPLLPPVARPVQLEEKKIVIVPVGGEPVNEAFTPITDDLVSDEVRGLGPQGVAWLTGGDDELLCIGYKKGRSEWFAVFAQWHERGGDILVDSPAVFASRERCRQRYLSRRRDELSTRQMDAVIDELDRRNDELAAQKKPPDDAKK